MRLLCVELCAAEPAALARFYGETLGLPVSREGDDVAILVGASRLRFQRSAVAVAPYHFAFDVPENRLPAAVAFLQHLDVPLLASVSGETVFAFDDWNAHAVYFLDPAGNIVEFIARHTVPNAVPNGAAPFSAAEILAVSEIGIATADVPAAAAQLREGLGIGDYRTGGAAFSPVGDEHGLFIVVREGRVWFPTADVPARPLPVTAVVQCSCGTMRVRSGPGGLHMHPADAAR